jgi:hypothetical protein
MIKTRLALAIMMIPLASAGCHQRKPKASEEFLSRIRAAAPGITDRCLDAIRYGGIEAMSNRVEKCFKMTPQRRWRGLWRDDFEGSTFCVEPAQDCPLADPDASTWLTLPDNLEIPSKVERGGLYQVEFLGRRTQYPGHYGHMGVFGQEMVVDRIISIKAQKDGGTR